MGPRRKRSNHATRNAHLVFFGIVLILILTISIVMIVETRGATPIVKKVWVFAKDYGLVGDSTDETTKMRTLLAAGKYGTVFLDTNVTYFLTDSVALDNVKLEGRGATFSFDLATGERGLCLGDNSTVRDLTVNVDLANAADIYTAPISVGRLDGAAGYSNILIENVTAKTVGKGGADIVITGNSYNIQLNNIKCLSLADSTRYGLLVVNGADANDSTYHPYDIHATNIWIDSLTPVDTNGYAISIDGAFGVTVENVTAGYCYLGLAVQTPIWGFDNAHSSTPFDTLRETMPLSVIVRNSNFLKCWTYGVRISGSVFDPSDGTTDTSTLPVLIQNCTFRGYDTTTGSGYNGINPTGANLRFMANNVVFEHCTFTNWNAAMGMAATDHVTWRSCTFAYNIWNVSINSSYYPEAITIEDCRVHHSYGESGIHLGKAKHVTVKDNIIGQKGEPTMLYGIHVDGDVNDSAMLVIKDNHVIDIKVTGVARAYRIDEPEDIFAFSGNSIDTNNIAITDYSDNAYYTRFYTPREHIMGYQLPDTADNITDNQVLVFDGVDSTFNWEAQAGAGSGDDAKADTGAAVVDLGSPFVIQGGANISIDVDPNDTMSIALNSNLTGIGDVAGTGVISGFDEVEADTGTFGNIDSDTVKAELIAPLIAGINVIGRPGDLFDTAYVGVLWGTSLYTTSMYGQSSGPLVLQSEMDGNGQYIYGLDEVTTDTITVNSVPIKDFEGTNLSVTAGVLNAASASGVFEEADGTSRDTARWIDPDGDTSLVVSSDGSGNVLLTVGNEGDNTASTLRIEADTVFIGSPALQDGSGDTAMLNVSTAFPGRFNAGNAMPDAHFGDSIAGLIEIGFAHFGMHFDTTYNSGLLSVGQTIQIGNKGTPVGPWELLFYSSDNNIRFGIPTSADSTGTYNPRSMIIAGPSILNDSICRGPYWGFTNLAMITSADGADLGVQNDVEILGDLFLDTIKSSGQPELYIDQNLEVSGKIVGDSIITDSARFKTLKIMPTATIAGIHWDGIYIDGDALDPSAVDATIHGIDIHFAGVDETNNPELEGIHITVPDMGDHSIHTNGTIFMEGDATASVAGENRTFIEAEIDVTGSTGGFASIIEATLLGEILGSTAEGVVIASFGPIQMINQHSGVYRQPDQAGADAECGKWDSSGNDFVAGLDGITVFDADNDAIFIGHADSVFSSIEIIFSSNADEGKSIQPTFWYATTTTAWTQFVPVDGTDGCEEDGAITFEADDLTGWADVDIAQDAAEHDACYWIKIVRTRNGTPGTVTISTLKTLTGVKYSWDGTGDLDVDSVDCNTIDVAGNITVSGTVDGVDIGALNTQLAADTANYDDAWDSVSVWDNLGYSQATTTALGIASFDANDFDVTAGAVSIDNTNFDLADIPGGTAGASAFDFGGATSVEIPNVADPTTDAEGEVAWDANDDAIEVYMGDETESALIPAYQKIDAHIFAPDGVNDQIAIFHVDALLYPFGIEIDQVSITIPADAAYSMVFEEWAGDPPVAQADIETVSTGATDSYMEDATITNDQVDADDYIFLDIPATNVDWIHVQVIYHVNDGN